MITISTAEQNAFQSSLPKTLTLDFPFNTLTNEDIFLESAQLEQAVCEESNLTFGMVYSSCFSVRIFDDGNSYIGQTVIPRISVTDGSRTYTRSLGVFTVKSDKLTSDKLYRDLKCYDYLSDVLPVNFVKWHNSLPTSITFKEYRDAFFNKIQVTQKSITLPNDNERLKRSTVTELTGADVLASILQLNGAFGHMDVDGEFRYVLPKTTADYTISDNSFVQGSLIYEDEPIKSITGVRILGYTDDYGDQGSYSVADAHVGDASGNELVIENNYFLQSAPIPKRMQVCTNIYNAVNGYTYHPTSVELPVYIGMEPGDVFKIETDRQDVIFPVFKRTLKGITSLMDEVVAEGESDTTQTNNSVTTGVSSTSMAINQVRESVAEMLAGKASISAQEAAISAKNSANSALIQLSIVEDVAGTLQWIQKHGDFVPSTDTLVDINKVYFVKEYGDYVPIIEPDPTKNPSEEGWYVLDVSASQSDYIMSHLAVTSAGLWVLPVNGYAPHYLVDENGNQFIDSNGNPLIDFSPDERYAEGYKVLLSAGNTGTIPVGLSIFDEYGQIVANYGTEINLYKPGTSTAAVRITNSQAYFTGSVTADAGEIGGWTIDADKLSRSDGNGNTVKLVSTGLDITADNPYGSQQLVNRTKISQGSMSLKHYDAEYMSEALLTGRQLVFDATDGNSSVTCYGEPYSSTPYVRVGERFTQQSTTYYRYLQLYFNLDSGNSGLRWFSTNDGYDYSPFWINSSNNVVIQGDSEVDLLLHAPYPSGYSDRARIVFYEATDGTGNLLFRPNSDNLIYLGSTANRWKQLLAVTVTGWSAYDQRSDLKDKSIIEDYDWKVDEFIKGLKPIAFKWKEGSTGRIHMGFGAQDVSKLAKDLGIGDLSVYAAEVKTDNEINDPYHGEDIDDSKLEWTMKYSELIAPMVLEIQRLMNRVEELEAKLNG